MPLDANCLYIGTDTSNNNEMNINNWLITDEFGNIKFKQYTNCMPFGCGPNRHCPGNLYALKQIYSIVANIVINYKIKKPNDKEYKISIKEGYTRELHPIMPVLVEKRT